MICRHRYVTIIAILTVSLAMHVLALTPAWADSLKISQQLTIYDSLGTKVGDVSDTSQASLPTATFRVGDFKFLLIVYKMTFLGNSGSDIYFESTDCSGTPYMRGLSEFMILPATSIALPGNKVYGFPADSTRSTITAHSHLPYIGPDTVSTACAGTEETFDDAVIAIPLVNLDDYFVPPYIAR